ncbi:MAG: RNase adapter RapZ [Clostridia bacterium]|nr:RNase adapter RapZ [Clostridia bacterium]
MRFVIITGISGAGKSQTVKCMEELGFYCVDNLPPVLIPKFAEICIASQGNIDKAALVVDIRGREMFSEVNDILSQLNFDYEVLFLEASDSTIIKRYKETRRMHPLSPDGKIIDGINKERILLSKLRERADNIIDTSKLTNSQLKDELVNIFVDGNKHSGLIIEVTSFGFKYGIPADADLVFDVRFLPNPFYIDELKNLTGLDSDVQNYVCRWEQTNIFLDKVHEMLEFLIPFYAEEGKTQLVIAIGCTGGMHRSVTMTEKLFTTLKDNGHRVIKNHRDIYKDGLK